MIAKTSPTAPNNVTTATAASATSGTTGTEGIIELNELKIDAATKISKAFMRIIMPAINEIAKPAVAFLATAGGVVDCVKTSFPPPKVSYELRLKSFVF
jgi:hypothetical protein